MLYMKNSRELDNATWDHSPILEISNVMESMSQVQGLLSTTVSRNRTLTFYTDELISIRCALIKFDYRKPENPIQGLNQDGTTFKIGQFLPSSTFDL